MTDQEQLYLRILKHAGSRAVSERSLLDERVVKVLWASGASGDTIPRASVFVNAGLLPAPIMEQIADWLGDQDDAREYAGAPQTMPDAEDRRRLREAGLVLFQHALLAIRVSEVDNRSGFVLMSHDESILLIRAMREILDEQDAREPVVQMTIRSDYGATRLLRAAAIRADVRLRLRAIVHHDEDSAFPGHWSPPYVYLPDKFVMRLNPTEAWLDSRTHVYHDARLGRRVGE